jgi:hypothetical protein
MLIVIDTDNSSSSAMHEFASLQWQHCVQLANLACQIRH